LLLDFLSVGLLLDFLSEIRSEQTFEDFCWADAQDAVQKEKFSKVIPLFALLHKMTVAVTFENFYQADAQDVVQK